MITLDFSQVELEQLVTHQVGNKSNEEGFTLSTETSSYEDKTLEYLVKYFLNSFKTEEFYMFDHSVDLNMNEVYSLAKSIFASRRDFIQHSQDIAKLLYDSSTLPNIKTGECNIAYFSQIALAGSNVEAIGIFKSETDSPFIKMTPVDNKFLIQHDFGFELKGIDKGCIILNTEENDGFKTLIVDNTNKSADAQYWSRDFLQIKPCSDDYHHTKQFMNITKDFLINQLPEDFDFSKTDKIDFMNRSVDYFKSNESFDKQDFEETVFQDEQLIDSFRRFDQNFRENHNLDLADSFEISSQAVRKQARVFKSVLKLDKNFHIYIHGDKSLIERGTENDGRKYYKIYYHQEQ